MTLQNNSNSKSECLKDDRKGYYCWNFRFTTYFVGSTIYYFFNSLVIL